MTKVPTKSSFLPKNGFAQTFRSFLLLEKFITKFKYIQIYNKKSHHCKIKYIPCASFRIKKIYIIRKTRIFVKKKKKNVEYFYWFDIQINIRVYPFVHISYYNIYLYYMLCIILLDVHSPKIYRDRQTTDCQIGTI